MVILAASQAERQQQWLVLVPWGLNVGQVPYIGGWSVVIDPAAQVCFRKVRL